MLDDYDLYLGKLTETEIAGKSNNKAKATGVRFCTRISLKACMILFLLFSFYNFSKFEDIFK